MQTVAALSQIVDVAPGVPFLIPAALVGNVQLGEAAEFFPPMQAAALDALVADVRANGQRTPVAFSRGLVADGRHRVSAAAALGRDLVAINLGSDVDPMAFAMSANAARRNVSSSQGAMLAARLYARERANGMQHSEAARRFGVSDRYLRDAQWLEQNDAVRATLVWRGDMALKSAVRARQAEIAAAAGATPAAVDAVEAEIAEASAPVVAPAGTLEQFIAQMIDGSLEPGAWVAGLVPSNRAALINALDEFARRAYDMADDAGYLRAAA